MVLFLRSHLSLTSCQEKHATVSSVIPMLQLIEASILKEKESDTQLTKDIEMRVITDLQSRFSFQ